MVKNPIETSDYPGQIAPAPGGTQGHIHYSFSSLADWIAFLAGRITALETQLKKEKNERT